MKWLFIFPLCILEVLTVPQSIHSRIIGGLAAGNGQFPYAAAVLYKRAEGWFLCGGALISDLWVLTCAQCLYGDIEDTIIYLGTHNLSSASPHLVVAYSKEIVIHPDYDDSQLLNDVALVSLSEPVKFNDYIKPLQLPSEPLNFGEDVLTMGWGTTNDAGIGAASALNYVELNTISAAECSNVYGSLQNSIICTSGTENKGICFGDVGGPLVKVTEHDHVHVGIASFSHIDGCEQGHPSGFTSTYHYLEWIKSIIGHQIENDGTTEFSATSNDDGATTDDARTSVESSTPKNANDDGSPDDDETNGEVSKQPEIDSTDLPEDNNENEVEDDDQDDPENPEVEPETPTDDDEIADGNDEPNNVDPIPGEDNNEENDGEPNNPEDNPGGSGVSIKLSRIAFLVLACMLILK